MNRNEKNAEYKFTRKQYGFLQVLQKHLQSKERPGLRKLGEELSVNASTLSRFYGECVSWNILTEDYEFTPTGEALLEEYRRKREDISLWLQKEGMDCMHAYDQAECILEACSEETVEVLSKLGILHKAIDSLKSGEEHVQTFNGRKLSDFLAVGDYDMSFTFYREKDRIPGRISMANQAFHHPGHMSCRKRDGYLELMVREVEMPAVHASSSIKGRMQTMKYKEDGICKLARIKNNKVRIPLSALTFTYIQESNILQGAVHLTMTCNEEESKMPESTAVLVLYI
ncbi:hypothetical protein [uncultured Robinsoniella sp.]|uniref:hypothetical protein n=1 Tax=uncultured Robinsoniella sp. TaxID=904190 RepID=UPI00374ED55A